MKLYTAFTSMVFAAIALPCLAQQSAMLPPDKAAAETVRFLKDLIQIDTQDPPGNESRVASYLAAIL